MVPCPPRPPRRIGPGGIGGRPRGEQEKQVEGALQDRRSGRGEEGICPSHSSPGSLLDSQVRSPRSETRVGGTPGPLLFLEPKAHHPTAPRAFSSPVGPEHWPCPLPKPRPCLGPTLHSQGLFPLLFFLFFLLPFYTIVVVLYLLVVDSCVFLFLYSF